MLEVKRGGVLSVPRGTKDLLDGTRLVIELALLESGMYENGFCLLKARTKGQAECGGSSGSQARQQFVEIRPSI